MKRAAIGVLVAATVLPAYLPILARAQIALPGISANLSISLSPAHPGPGDTVRLSARSSIIDLGQSEVVWRSGATVIAQGQGVSDATIQAGALGTETDVSVSVIAQDGTAAFATAAIVPTSIDLLFDSDSFVPPFYTGRPLPSAGTSLHMLALTHMRRPGGLEVPASDIVFTWKRNSEVIGAVSGRGKSAVIISSPPLFGTDVIEVDAESSDGALSGAASVRIPSTEPVLALYEDHPLFGLLYHRALGASSVIAESEMTFAAVPYFAQARSANDPLLQYEWKVNDATVATDPKNRSEITINASNSSGLALIDVFLTHATNFFLQAHGAWSVGFSAGTPADQFHATQ